MIRVILDGLFAGMSFDIPNCYGQNEKGNTREFHRMLLQADHSKFQSKQTADAKFEMENIGCA